MSVTAHIFLNKKFIKTFQVQYPPMPKISLFIESTEKPTDFKLMSFNKYDGVAIYQAEEMTTHDFLNTLIKIIEDNERYKETFGELPF